MNTRRLVVVVSLFGVLSFLGIGCREGRAPALDADTPGFGDVQEIACRADSECRDGETCADNVCQMKRCTDTASYHSASPFGARGYLVRDRQIVSAGGRKGASHAPSEQKFTEKESWTLPANVVDVTGGNLLGKREESTAFALEGQRGVVIDGAAIDTNFAPTMLATGDIDGDGVDEIIAADETGNVAVCRAASRKCTDVSPGRSALLDVTTADLDGDGRAEILLLTDGIVSVVKPDAKEVADFKAPPRLYRIAGGELRDPGKDGIVALQHGDGWFSSDSLVQLELGGSTNGGEAQPRGTIALDGSALDVVIDSLGSREGKPIVLVSGGRVDVFDVDDLRLAYRAQLTATDATRLAAVDLEGRSAIFTLKSKEAELVASDAAPVSAVFAPPYSQAFSGGVSLAGVGATSSDSNSKSESVAISYGLSVGAGFDLPLQAVNIGANISFHMGWGGSRSKTQGTSTSVGSSFWLSVDPEADDYKSGAVLLSCGCFHRYDYQVDDRAGLVPSADKKGLRILVPVGGQTAIWSVRRYNALASQLAGQLPAIQVPYTDGAIESYPSKPTRFDGKPVPTDDIVFPKSPWLRASDAADVWFNLDAAGHSSSSTARSVSTSYSASVSVGIGPVSANAGVDYGKSWDFSEEIGVSDSTSFIGMVPALKNKPETPEDEYAANVYSFQPVVYVHRYELPNGRKSGFYVLTYAVKQE